MTYLTVRRRHFVPTIRRQNSQTVRQSDSPVGLGTLQTAASPNGQAAAAVPTQPSAAAGRRQRGIVRQSAALPTAAASAAGRGLGRSLDSSKPERAGGGGCADAAISGGRAAAAWNSPTGGGFADGGGIGGRVAAAA